MRARERLAKAQPLTTQRLATLTFFFATLLGQVEALALPPHLERALVEPLIPALYLKRVAACSAHALTLSEIDPLFAHKPDPH